MRPSKKPARTFCREGLALMFLEVDEDFPTHPKSIRLGVLTGNPVAWAFIQKLWCFCCKHQKDGDLTAYEPAEIEGFAGWTANDGVLYAAAVKVGFIDEEEECDAGGAMLVARRVHNWMKRTGDAIVRMRTEAERKKSFREAKRAERAANRPPDVPRTSTGRPADEDDEDQENDGPRPPDVHPDVTHQDKTRQGKASQGKSSQDGGSGSGARARVEEKRSVTFVPEPGPEPLVSGGVRITAHDVTSWFGVDWRETHNGEWWKPTKADTEAARDLLEDRIGSLPEHEQGAAVAAIRPAIKRYLADQRDFYVKQGHRFGLFAKDFDAFRSAPPTPEPRRVLTPIPMPRPNARQLAREAEAAEQPKP
jgi:hypothetical protein